MSSKVEKPAAAEELEEECGFCVYMKGGGCKESFTKWSDCVDKYRDSDKDFTEACHDQTVALQECMFANKEYYKDFIGLGDAPEETNTGKSVSKASNDSSALKSAPKVIEEPEPLEDDSSKVVIKTLPYDRRFVTTNQSRHCFVKYQEYHRCLQQSGEDNADCLKFKKAYSSICPIEWTEKWDEERSNGVFPGKF